MSAEKKFQPPSARSLVWCVARTVHSCMHASNEYAGVVIGVVVVGCRLLLLLSSGFCGRTSLAIGRADRRPTHAPGGRTRTDERALLATHEPSTASATVLVLSSATRLRPSRLPSLALLALLQLPREMASEATPTGAIGPCTHGGRSTSGTTRASHVPIAFAQRDASCLMPLPPSTELF